jgi:hypothetical protein
MNNDIERQLCEALQPVDPEPGFTQRVMTRIASEQPRGRLQPRRWPPMQFRRLPVALAASAICGAVLVNAWHVRHERQGLEARQQLIEALRVTGRKLDLAYRVVNPESAPTNHDVADDTGA